MQQAAQTRMQMQGGQPAVPGAPASEGVPGKLGSTPPIPPNEPSTLAQPAPNPDLANVPLPK